MRLGRSENQRVRRLENKEVRRAKGRRIGESPEKEGKKLRRSEG